MTSFVNGRHLLSRKNAFFFGIARYPLIVKQFSHSQQACLFTLCFRLQFAHLLENSRASRGGSYDVMRQGASDKQLKWEDKKAGKQWRRRVDWSRGRGAKERGASKRRNFNNRTPQNKFTPKGRGFKA